MVQPIEKKSTIILDNFSSKANLASNPGFQSTLSIGSANVITEKPYDPFLHRKVEHPNSIFGTGVHLLKSALGSGLLAMPLAFMNAGAVAGFIGTILVGFLCTHCIYVVVKTSQELCVRAKKPSMGFAETCSAAFEYGPEKIKFLANFARLFVNFGMICTYLLALCIYIVFIATNTKKILDDCFPDYKIEKNIYCAMTLPLLLVMAQIRNLKWLVPFSALANFFLMGSFLICLYYIFDDLPRLTDRTMVADINKWPIFLCTLIFAMEGIGAVIPIENDMEKPQYFLGFAGVFNITMGIVVLLYGCVGLLGYIKYGDKVEATITLNLPKKDMLAQAAQLLLAFAVLFSYGLQFYVPMDLIWRMTSNKIPVQHHNAAQIVMRTLMALGTVIAAVVCPYLDIFIGICGSIFLTLVGFFTPAVVDTIHRWEKGYGFLNWILWKNFIIVIISFIIMVFGTLSTIDEIYK